jgi:hypothetical protein
MALTTQDALEVARGISDTARRLLEQSGSLMPVAFLHSDYPGQRGLDVIGLPFHNEREKALAASHLRKAAKKKKATMAVQVQEAWLAVLDEQEAYYAAAEGVSASSHPKRKEVVWFIVELPGALYLGQVDIVRDEFGKPSFGPVEFKPVEPGEMAGRWIGILPGNEAFNEVISERVEQMGPGIREFYDQAREGMEP